MPRGGNHAGREYRGTGGERAFGVLETASTRSGLRLDIPVHVFAGAAPGPTLLVQGAVHGTEIIGTIAILNRMRSLGPGEHAGGISLLCRWSTALDLNSANEDHASTERMSAGSILVIPAAPSPIRCRRVLSPRSFDRPT